MDKIVAGRLDKYYGDVCLLEQAYIMDGDLKVSNKIRTECTLSTACQSMTGATAV